MAAAPGDSHVLDLVDIALLLTYERASADPRFRRSKLYEVVLPGRDSTMLPVPVRAGDNETLIVLDAEPPAPPSSTSEPDTPLNMLPARGLAPASPLSFSTPEQLETYFHRPRCHDMCFPCVAMLQYFLDLFPPSTRLRIRHGPQPSGPRAPAPSYVTSVDTFRIVEQTLLRPRVQTTTFLVSQDKGYTSGGEDHMVHAVARFSPPAQDPVVKEQGIAQSFLDLSSMQFGDLGRGPGRKGRGLFALDSASEYHHRVGTICHAIVPGSVQVSNRVTAHPTLDAWFREVAARAKQRLEARAEDKWCGHCGAPVRSDSKCGGCKAEWYCSRDHQKMAWGFHKSYCSRPG